MPITATTDYIPTMDEFSAHWETADSAVFNSLSFEARAWELGDFQNLRTQLDVTTAAFHSALNDLEISRLTLNQLRHAMAAHITDFNRRVRVEFSDNPRFAKLPPSPNRTAGRAVFLDAMDDVLDLWKRVNATPTTAAFSAPLTLIDGTTFGQFSAMRRQLDEAFTARSTAENAVSRGRVERNLIQDRAYALMKQYRLNIEARFPSNSPEMLTLPALTPTDGHTPDPVMLTATWSAEEEKAKLDWAASPDPALQDYQIRAVPGEEYDADSESVVATILPSAPLVFLTGNGFAMPGAAVSYRVYVRLKSGNTRGSQTATVHRPG